MITFSICIIDDDPVMREGLTMVLGKDHDVSAFASGEEAIREIEACPPDLVLLDIGLPGRSGIDVLRDLRSLHPALLVIMVTAHEEIATAVEAMRLGAHDYVTKPFRMADIKETVRRALETIRLVKEVKRLQEKHLLENVPFFIGESDVIRDVMDFVDMVARSATTPVLVLGETGTGKELIAKAIHFRSPNFKGPLIAVNCAAIPRELIESELFGYERGAFSGARTTGKKGLIQEADKGTLFLDEVGELGPEAQAKLLRFLEGGEFYRVGGTEKLRVRTRVVSATNRDLEALIEQGRFRDDLYFRLGVVKMRVPSLKERPDDILPLAKHFLYEFSREFGKGFHGISKETESALKGYAWRGNIRELKNFIERAVLVGRGEELTVEDLGLKTPKKAHSTSHHRDTSEFPPLPPEGIDFASLQHAFEKYYVEQAYRMAEGNESRAARLLNMNHHTFRYHRKKLRIL